MRYKRRRAFPAWRHTSRIRRGELFLNLANLIRRDTDALAAVLARENGKVLNEARAEVVEGLHMVEYVFGTARSRPARSSIPRSRPKTCSCAASRAA